MRLAKEIYISLPVQDVSRSIAFYTALGFTFNPKMAGEKNACMILDDRVFVMLMQKDFFQTFTPKPIADAHTHATMQIAIGLESREAVDAMVEAAVKAGGKGSLQPNDYGWMYTSDFEDLDGHAWGPMYASQPPK